MKVSFPPILIFSLCLLVFSCSKRENKSDRQIIRETNEQEQIKHFLDSRSEKFLLMDSRIWVSVSQEGDSIKPVLSSIITTAYRTESLDGLLVDSATEDKPLRMRLARLIEGWQKALPLIGQGGKLKMIVPAELAYKERSIHPQLEGWTPLYFEIDLLKVEHHQP